MGRLSLAIWMAALLCLGAGEATASWWNVDHDDHRTWKVALSGGAFRQDLDGKVQVDSALGSAMVDVDVLDLNHEDSGWAEIDLQLFQKHHLRFLYLPIEFDGDTVLQVPITFGDVTFDISDRVRSEVEFDTYELSYRYDIYLGKWVTLSPLIQVSLIDARIHVADETQFVTMNESQLVPIPALGLRAEVYPIARIGAFVEAKGFTIGSEGTMWDVQGGLRLHLIRNFFLTGSYRVIDYDVDYLDVDVNVRMQGPFVGATLRF
jgi:hypothetical protein